MLMRNIIGKQLFENPLMCDVTRVQVRFPRSRRKRIRKKWRKDSKNYREVVKPWETVYLIGDFAVAHPVTIKRLKGLLEDVNLEGMTYEEASIFG